MDSSGPMLYVERVVVWTTLRARLANVMLALAALAFVLIPAADAAACAPEPIFAVADVKADLAATAWSDAEHAPDVGGEHSGEACVHGHCHHQGQSVAAPLGEEATVWPPSAISRAITADRAPPGAEPALLQRPPRA